MYGLISQDYLMHHGVKGMKWGVRHDPERVGRKKKKQDPKSKEIRKQRTKKYIKRGVIVAGAVLAVAGGYYLYKNNKKEVIDKGKQYIDDTYGSSDINTLNLGKDISSIDMNMIKNINEECRNLQNGGGGNNCVHATTAYILNSLFGQNKSALSFSGVDEVSGMTGNGREYRIYDSIFDGLKHTECNNSKLEKAIDQIKPGSTGIIGIAKNYPEVDGSIRKHVMVFEKTKNGDLSFIDPSQGLAKKVDNSVVQIFNSGYNVVRFTDFSNASLKPEAEEILKKLVK